MTATRNLGDLASFRTGKLNSNAATPNGAYPFFTCSQETYRTDTCAFNTECVLLAGNNANGIYPIKYFSGKFDAYQRTYVIESLNQKALVTRYLYFALQPQLAHLRSVSTGAATKFLTLPILRGLQIRVPELMEQRRIASILSAYDDLIENSTRRIAILEEMARRIYEEWFVRFRFPGHENVRMVESELGLVPEGWTVASVGSRFKTVLGGTPSRANTAFWEGGTVPWINSGKVNELRILEPSEHITELALAKSAAKMMPAGTTVLAITGATLGQVSMLGAEACANQSVVGIYEPTGQWRDFVFWFFKVNIGSIIQHASGGAQQHINKDIVNAVSILLPEVTVLQRFNAAAAPMSELVIGLLKKNINLRTTRDLLLPKLISGELDVSAMPEPEAAAG